MSYMKIVQWWADDVEDFRLGKPSSLAKSLRDAARKGESAPSQVLDALADIVEGTLSSRRKWGSKLKLSPPDRKLVYGFFVRQKELGKRLRVRAREIAKGRGCAIRVVLEEQRLQREREIERLATVLGVTADHLLKVHKEERKKQRSG